MHVVPIKTERFEPPQDDITSTLAEVSQKMQEGDILCIASKVVAIHEGRCVPIEGTDKEKLIQEESDYYLKRAVADAPLTIKNNTFVWAGGIDEANGGGYYVLLPKDPTASAKFIYDFLKQKTGYTHIGVIITDSFLVPFRAGVVGISIGHYGFHPTHNYVGTEDLFGRPFQFTQTNIVDSLASAATVVGGEGSEQTPLVVIHDAPNITFTNKDTQSESHIPPENDAYQVLLNPFLHPNTDEDAS